MLLRKSNSLKKIDLLLFEDKIVNLYENKKIKGPIHLSGNNENQLIKIFRKIKKNDWVFSNWRSHYHALLKGLDQKYILNEIIKGKSMNINHMSKKFFTSSIVGGTLPIALGVALANKLKKNKSIVWVFIGDMTFETGVFHECYKYSQNFKLPIRYIIEDNNMSTNTETAKAWGGKQKIFNNITHYKYLRKYPHHGTGKWVLF
jgi:TPP-dependent pyruvate/acetoin dehydrogenase alpha subunit